MERDFNVTELFIAGVLHNADCKQVGVTQDNIIYNGAWIPLENLESVNYDKVRKTLRIETISESIDIDLEYDLLESYDKERV